MAVLTTKNDVNNIHNFFEDILASDESYYFFVGRTLPWPDDTNPPAANDSYAQIEQSIYHDLAFGKQITNNNIAYLAPNIPWVNNTVYTPFDQNNGNYFGANTYVVTSNYSIYKCIDNGSNSVSTIQPTIQPTAGTFQTSDGYTWKYMYTIPVNANTTFTTSKFVPVIANTFVANNAVPGTIDVIRVTGGGSNWQTFNEGFLTSVVSQSSVVLANTASALDNFYTGASIYLKAGLGAAQIRPITSYNGATRTATVSPWFNTLVNLQLNNASVSGAFLVGQQVVQTVIYLGYLFEAGSFNANDFIVQSDSLASGYVTHSNSSIMTVHSSSNGGFNIINNYPIFNTTDSFFTLTGTVSTTAGSNTLTGVTANLLNLAVNNYVQVGAVANLNIRRITSITNSSIAHVSVPFNNTLVANAFNQVNNAIEPVSQTISTSSGVITQLSLTSIRIDYANTSSNALTYILGETVKEYDGSNIDQSANAVVSFANSSTLILSAVNGIMTPGLFLVGQSSTLKSQISDIITYPNITLANALGTFSVGDMVYALNANGTTSGSANVVSYSYTPSATTEYVIAPTVNINGDGANALAYSVVNTAVGSHNEITDIVMINTGMNYTNATASVTSNNLYGNGASLVPVVSPVAGHGADAVTELGAEYAGISVTFDTAATESYYFPNYGSYRRVGIIKNPTFQNLYVQYANLTVANLGLHNISGAFVNNEIVFQPATNTAAKIMVTNSTFAQVKDINGTFASNASNASVNNVIIGLKSNAYANVITANLVAFSILSNTQIINETNSIATATISQVLSNNTILVSKVSGKFANSNNCIYDLTNNATANGLTFFIGNNTSQTTTFGNKFNQLSRVTLSSNTATLFSVGEYVNQSISNATGLVIDTTHELDLILNGLSGTFSAGIVATDANTSANATITFANSTYLKLTAVNGNFNIGDKVTCLTGNAFITQPLTVLTIGDLFNDTNFVYNYNITGNTSGAIGVAGIANTITSPDLVRNSGSVLYINNIKPFTLGPSTKETFSTVITF